MRAAAAGARRGDVRHRAAAQVRRGPVPHHRWPLADPHRRSLPHQLGARADPRRSALPIRLTALTPCFRSEAGAAGATRAASSASTSSTRCELVTICRPEDSEAEHEHMVARREPSSRRSTCPIARCCCAPATWASARARPMTSRSGCPARAPIREISSCLDHWCGDFQARRMNARYRPEGEKGTAFVHTLNGSGLAVGRTLVAVLENYQQADGSVVVPAKRCCPTWAGIDRLSPPQADAHPPHQRRRHPRPRPRCWKRSRAELSDDVWVCAPAEEQSGAGHSLTLHPPGAAAPAWRAALLRHRHADRCGEPGAAQAVRRRQARPDHLRHQPRREPGRRHHLFGHHLGRDGRRAGGHPGDRAEPGRCAKAGA
jgi:hypothetical protein